MSAAEKLRALMGDERWRSHDPTVLAGLALTFHDVSGGGILPQIVAEVEAAERIATTEESVWGTSDGVGFVLQEALAALDEALGAVT